MKKDPETSLVVLKGRRIWLLFNGLGVEYSIRHEYYLPVECNKQVL